MLGVYFILLVANSGFLGYHLRKARLDLSKTRIQLSNSRVDYDRLRVDKAYYEGLWRREATLCDHYRTQTARLLVDKNYPDKTGRDPKLKERAVKLMGLAFSKANTNEARVAQTKLKELITKEL